MLHFCVCLKSACCSCVHHALEARLHILLSILNFLWCELFSDFSFFYGLLLLGAGLCLIVGFSFFNPLFHSFLKSYYHFLLHYSAIPTMISFDPSLLGFFGPAAYSSLDDSIWSLGFFITLLAGSYVPFISSWASLAHLLSLGILSPF